MNAALSRERHGDDTFDYLIANPAYGKDWKRDEDAMRGERAGAPSRSRLTGPCRQMVNWAPRAETRQLS